MDQTMRIFIGPAKYAVYGTFAGTTARVTGCQTLAECDDAIATHLKQFPGCSYSIWEASWTKLKEIKP
jgi:hypothetical protein